MSERFDFVVIGAGPAGEKAAAQAAYFGHRVAIVDRGERPGGAVVNSGVIPSKTLRETALYLSGFRKRDVYGVGMSLTPEFALDRLKSRAAEVVAEMAREVHENIERHGVELIRGTARLAPGRVVTVTGIDGATRELDAGVVLIATGSRPYRPDGIPFDDPDVHDSESILDLGRIPKRMAVIGGGPVACEYASLFAALGVEVTLVDSGRRLLSFADEEIAQELASIFAAMPMRVEIDAGAASVERSSGSLVLRLAGGESVEIDAVLFAAGRVGNTEGLGLEAAGVETDERGRIVVDASYRSTAEGVFAAGDVIGPPALASVSAEQGRVAACHAFGITFKQTVDPQPPFGVYSIPEVGMVGLTEEQAATMGIPYETGRTRFGDNARGRISGATEGLIKLVFDATDRRVLGVHILSDDATELIHHGQAVLQAHGTIDWFIQATYNMPSRTEAYKYAAYDGLQRLSSRPGGSALEPGPCTL